MTGDPLARRTLLKGGIGLGLGAGLGLSLPGRAFAQVTGTRLGGDKPVVDPATSLDAWIDVWGRPTAKVMLNGRGPYQFLVDTGSNITVLANRCAQEIGAAFTGTAMVNGTTGSAEMPVAQVDRIETGVVKSANVRVAVLPDSALSRQDGILGADVFSGRKLAFNIQAKRVNVETSDRSIHFASRMASNSNMRVRNGRLAEIDGRVGKVHILMMLDTGADNCIANRAADGALQRAFPHMKRVDHATVLGVTGQVLFGDLLVLPDIWFGGVILRDATAVATDAPIFKVWDLMDKPAMIVGVSVLSRLAQFSIDYGAQQFEAHPLALLASQGPNLG